MEKLEVRIRKHLEKTESIISEIDLAIELKEVGNEIQGDVSSFKKLKNKRYQG